MKRLYVLRHAKSSWDDAGLADHDRPLSGRMIDFIRPCELASSDL
jgi:phosphohistidine phosphatase SixA